MPAAFQSSYTPIAAAGTEDQIRHLSRMIAAQLTSAELGPGVEKIRTEKQQHIGYFSSLQSVNNARNMSKW